MDGNIAHEYLLDARGLTKAYVLPHKRVQVLVDAEIHAAPGELVAVVGHSGAGKSTLLHVLGGLDRPENGEVLICGESFYKSTAHRRTRLRAEKIGFVFQSYHLLPEMSVLENVMLPAMAVNMLTRAEMQNRAGKLLALVGLSDRIMHKPVELSGGEQQRVAIARALMNEPPLILADEPTGNLDKETGSQLLDLLFGLARDSRRAMIIVTHDPAVAVRCDRCLNLDGCVLEPADRSLFTTKCDTK